MRKAVTETVTAFLGIRIEDKPIVPPALCFRMPHKCRHAHRPQGSVILPSAYIWGLGTA